MVKTKKSRKKKNKKENPGTAEAKPSSPSPGLGKGVGMAELQKAVNEGNPFPLIIGMVSSAIALGKGLAALKGQGQKPSQVLTDANLKKQPAGPAQTGPQPAGPGPSPGMGR